MARIVYTDMSGAERSVPIGQDYPVVTIGRATDCTIRSNRKSVSRRHAEFRFANGQFEVVDLNSSNGTYLIINEERKPVLGREYLAHNDEVWCGDFILRFYEEEDGPLEAYEEPNFGANRGAAHHATAPPSFGGNSYASNPDAISGQGGQGGQGGPTNGQFGQEPSWASQSPRQQGGQPSPQPPGFGQGASGGQGEQFGRGNDYGAGGQPSAGGQPGFGQSGDEPSPPQENVERLKAERDSFADVAERQKTEIDDLQRRLDETQRDNEKLRNEQQSAPPGPAPEEFDRVRDQLAEAQNELGSTRHDLENAWRELESLREENEALRDDVSSSELETELAQLRRENEDLRSDVAELGTITPADPQAQAEAARLLEQVEGQKRDISALEGEVDRLTEELRQMEQQAAEASKVEGQKNKEETEALRRELERHRRLVEEFEKRNRELQSEIDGANEVQDELRASADEQTEKLGELESELEALAADLEAARNERDEKQAKIEELQAAGSIDDLKNEIEGLKRRLKMEKERAGEDDARINEDIERLNQRVQELELENTELRTELDEASSDGGMSAASLGVLREKIEALDRIVDAIVRTNLDPLSTVDRIRLQSAVRDTDPETTLADLLELTSQE